MDYWPQRSDVVFWAEGMPYCCSDYSQGTSRQNAGDWGFNGSDLIRKYAGIQPIKGPSEDDVLASEHAAAVHGPT